MSCDPNVQVEILSHHGSEHYCPVSHFKIFGVSEIELIGEEDDEDDDLVTPGVVSTGTGNALNEEGEMQMGKGKEETGDAKGGIVSYIKAKVRVEGFCG